MIKNILKLVIGCWSFLPLMTSCHTAEKEKFDLLIVNASVPDIETGQVAYNQLIGIRQDTIRLVSGMKSVSHYGSEQTIDAKNGFVIPGLWDMHVHFRGGDSLITENRNLLPLFLSYGVTTVRDAGGDLTPSVLKWRRAIKKQEMVGPDIFTSGPKLDG